MGPKLLDPQHHSRAQVVICLRAGYFGNSGAVLFAAIVCVCCRAALQCPPLKGRPKAKPKIPPFRVPYSWTHSSSNDGLAQPCLADEEGFNKRQEAGEHDLVCTVLQHSCLRGCIYLVELR